MKNSLSNELKVNVKNIEEQFHHTSDLMFREIYHGTNNKLTIVYIDGITDLDLLQDSVIIPITKSHNGKGKVIGRNLIHELTTKVLTTPHIVTTKQYNDVTDSLIQGKAVLLVDKYEEAIVVDITAWKERALEESLGERTTRGPVVGFSEKGKTNISLLRGIIKTEDLCIKKETFGTKSKTDVFILYVNDVVDKGILKKVEDRIKKLDVKYVLESRVVQETLEGKPASFFPLTLSTERPDVVASGLLEGRVVVLVDGTPQALIAPSLFSEFFQAPDEYYSSYGRFSVRIIRLLSFLITIFLPGIYVALEDYGLNHFSNDTYNLLISKDELLPTLWEIILLNILLKIFLDSSFRIPKNGVLLVSILGAVILGQTAIDAKLIHPVSLLVIGIAFIASFTLGNKGLASTVTYLSASFILIGHFFSFMGIIVGGTVLFLYMTYLNSLGVPYLSPFLPLRPEELKDSLIRGNTKKLINSKHSFPDQ